MERDVSNAPAISRDGAALSVIVFAYNEAEALPAFFEELLTWVRTRAPRAEIVFVDDGSRDATPEVAASALAATQHVLCRHGQNSGIGAALRTGVRAATRPWFTFLPADGQIAPSDLEILLTKAEAEHVDLVLSTYRNRNDGLVRTVYSLGIRALIRLLHGVHLQSDGPYLARKTLFETIAPRSDSFFLNFEFPIRAHQKRVRVAVVEIGCRPRQAGRSKSARLRVIIKVAFELLKLRFARAASRGV